MRRFDSTVYDSVTCPLAKGVENVVNSGRSPEEQLRAIESIASEKQLWDFIKACIVYWPESGFDDRNRDAVFTSQAIMDRFPWIRVTAIPEKALLQGFAFTRYVHRALQQNFFRCVRIYLRNTGRMGISAWLDRRMS